MSKTINIISFLLGVAAGSLVTYQTVKEKYEKIVQSEIDSVKEYFSEKNDKRSEKNDSDNTMLEYEQILEEKNYVNYSNMSKPENDKPEDNVEKDERPYVIPPDQFGELDDYESITLTYYTDGVLADDNYEVVDDIDDTVGRESLEHFGEYEADTVYVRNDRHKCDYEICRDEESYSELVRDKPYL